MLKKFKYAARYGHLGNGCFSFKLRSLLPMPYFCWSFMKRCWTSPFYFCENVSHTSHMAASRWPACFSKLPPAWLREWSSDALSPSPHKLYSRKRLLPAVLLSSRSTPSLQSEEGSMKGRWGRRGGELKEEERVGGGKRQWGREEMMAIQREKYSTLW